MKTGGALRRVALLLLLLYLALALAATWWATAGRQGMIEREDNPRQAARQTTAIPAENDL